MLKKRWIVSITLLLFLCTACQQSSDATITKIEIPPAQAVEIAAGWAAMETLVQAGGVYEEGEYQRFNYKGKTYRYMASQLDTKKELRAQLEKWLTKKIAKRYMKEHNFIKQNKKLAQIESDGGSLLEWEMATAVLLKSKKNKYIFEISVPVGYTGTFDKFNVTFEYVKKSGWRISKLPEYVD